MASGKGLPDFPHLEAKLQKPAKKSAFEKSRAEAEAKRQREAQETAAVYEDFVKSFDRDDGGHGGGNFHGGGDSDRPAQPYGSGFGGQQQQQQQPQLGGGAGRRHFGALSSGPGTLPKSGPGSLGPVPPQSVGKKRPFEAFRRDTAKRSDDGRSILDDEGHGVDKRGKDREASLKVSRAFHASDDEEENGSGLSARESRAIAKPTIKLEHLPPGTSPAVIKALIPTNLTVENVKLIPPAQPGGTERKSMMAIVTLAQDTPATEIDSAVSLLQNRYLGFGHYLSLHRYLSSNLTSTAQATLGASASQPFGAKAVAEPSAPGGGGGFNRRFAPPPSHGLHAGAGVNRSGILHVPVRPPGSIKTVRLINRVIEGVLEHGAEFEALLMTRPEVQRDDKWAWIWDARSEGGIWYRWRLWEIVTGGQKPSKGKYIPLFDGGSAWKVSEKRLAYEYTTDVDEFVSDPEYDSDDDYDLDRDGGNNGKRDGVADGEMTFLNPMEKARLAHMLARLPTTLSKIKKGDIARVTAFAITHASRGVDEIVDMIVTNVTAPYALTAAGTSNGTKNDGGKQDEEQAQNEGDATTEGVVDNSAASLVGLYVVSDVLSSSSTSGVRHAWRFRQLFEAALREHKTLEMLGMMADRLGWGRMRAEKWKRSVNLVLSQWELWCVFPTEAHQGFVKQFEEPAELQRRAEAVERERERERRAGSGWKKVEDQGVPKVQAVQGEEEEEDVEGAPMEEEDDGEEEDVAGEPMLEDKDVDEDEDLAGEPMDEEDDVDGVPMDEEDDDAEGGVSMGDGEAISDTAEAS